jgi:PPM family protein phosphatase
VLDIDFAQLSDSGRVRANNEDYVGYSQPASADEARSHGWLFALADGVGGSDRGEVASRTAVEGLLSGFRAASANEPLSSLLLRLVRDANQRVYETAAQSEPGGSTMSTTLVACALRYDRAAVAHAGDSRCYLVRDGKTQQLTRDHTVAADQARLGILTSAEASQATTRNVLSRSLGTGLFLNPDVAEHQLLPGDVLLLCCDGLYHSVTGADIAAAASLGDLDAAVRGLISLANQRDGGDNITVQLIRIRSVERVGMYRGRPYKLR